MGVPPFLDANWDAEYPIQMDDLAGGPRIGHLNCCSRSDVSRLWPWRRRWPRDHRQRTGGTNCLPRHAAWREDHGAALPHFQKSINEFQITLLIYHNISELCQIVSNLYQSANLDSSIDITCLLHSNYGIVNIFNMLSMFYLSTGYTQIIYKNISQLLIHTLLQINFKYLDAIRRRCAYNIVFGSIPPFTSYGSKFASPKNWDGQYIVITTHLEVSWNRGTSQSSILAGVGKCPN